MVDERTLISELGRHYKKIYIPLDTARENEEFEIYGDFILVEDINAGTKCEIRLNSKQNDPVNLIKVRRIESPFSKFYLSNDALSGGYVKLLIGGEAKFSATPVMPVEVEKANIYAYNGTTYIPCRIDSSNYGLLTKVVEMPVSSYTTDSISAVANVLELDLGTFTGAGAGSSNDVYPGYKTVTWQINSDSSGTAHDVRLQGSLDNSNWFDLDVSSTTGNEMRHVINKPVRYLRVNVVSMGDASSITVKAFLKDA